MPSDSKPIAAQQSPKPWTLLFPTKPAWLVSRVPKQSHKRGGSQKLKQVLVTARLLGKTDYLNQQPSFTLTQNAGDTCGS